MSWKDLLAVLDPAADRPGRLALGVALAERFGAHAVGLRGNASGLRARGPAARLSSERRAAAEGPESDPAVHARYADLAILGQRDPDDEQVATFRPSLERVTLITGRPILVVPHAGGFETVGQRVRLA